MYHPEGFADSSNIIIKNNCAFYYYNGNSYLEKLKNGLSLECVFNEESIQIVSIFEKTNIKNISKNKVNTSSFECNDDFDSYYKLQKERKNIKCIKNKKRDCRNKKNRIRQNGFDDKIFNMNQNTIHIQDTLSSKELEELDWDEYYNEHYENYYKGIQEEMREYYQEYEEDNYKYDNDNYKELYRELLCGY